MELNESARRPDGVSGNIIYKWWCPKCQADHYDQYCPQDELELTEFANVIANGLEHIEFCPHYGQLIKNLEAM